MSQTQRSGPPPEARPRNSAPTRTTASVTDSSDTLPALVAQAVALVEQIGDQAERDRQSWRAGYREAMGFCRSVFDHGVDVGRAQAEEDMARAWRPVAESVRNIPRLMELQARRYPGYTPERLAELRARAREQFGLPSKPREAP